MSDVRWLGRAMPVAQVNTITIANTWTTGDTATLTINTKQLVLTAGTDVTTAQIATAIKEMINGDTQTGTGNHTFSETGDNVPEFAELTATVSNSVVTVTANTKGKPFDLTVTESTAGTGTAVGAVATVATGPNYYSNVNNWSTAAVPVSGVNEVQTITVDASGGTFTVTFSGQTTIANAFNIAAATLQANLEALSTIGTGNISVSGGPGAAGGGTPYTLTFQNDLGYQNVAEVTTDPALLTGGAGTAAVATSQAGSTGDDVFLDNSDVSILYDLAQSAVVVNTLNIAASFTGDIGLSKINNDSDEYVEYRADYLAIGATTVHIGLGPGSGSGRIKLNYGTVMNTTNVYLTGSADETDLEAVILKGTNIYNELKIRGNSSVGVAVFGGEAATFTSVDIGGSADVRFGEGCTLTTVEMSGGSLYLECSVTTLTQHDGTTTVDQGGVTTLDLRGGTVIYNSTGTLGTVTITGNAALDFSQDPRAKTVTNVIDRDSATCQILDPEVTVSNLRIDNNQNDDLSGLALGTNVRLTRGAVS